MIKAIIFDFDGLILDTESPIFLSWQEVYREHGSELALEEWAANVGTEDSFDPVAHLEGVLDKSLDAAAIRSVRKPREAVLIKAEPILPGVESYIAGAKRLGLKLAVASNSSRDWVRGHLARLELLPHFDIIKCWDDSDVGRRKPEPTVYQAALNALDITADQAIALEDSPNGILSATRSGIFTVAVPNALTRLLGVGDADMVLDSMVDMSLEDLLTVVSKKVSGS
ncbi:MAG: HAD-IA family hydrolase [SAR202 cluster bacterium]|jgi:HAD superfamily hydrolase (TIGR01509 family)|nr:HAD-IA family hydrolase [SAR202 cluster bacterium]|tara:strand:- start:859 stop:1536 length:678 start_codon:yes stop_codon:yes gene_type:complete